MKILADQNIPLVDELFSSVGSINRLPGREISSKDLVDIDVLLVRSVTQVNKNLLAGSAVKFVGSCTIGTDHLDTDFLNQHGIAWSNAPGCNSNAVVQYVLSAMAALKPSWRKLEVGIVGCGNIGGRLYKILKQLDVNCFCYDPFLPKESNIDLVPFEQILEADIVTCHTPLTRQGPYPTYHLFSEKELWQLNPDALLINACRGDVIDNEALIRFLKSQPLHVVLDVWQNEPDIAIDLLDLVSLGTVHIAGHSLEGKEMGTFMVLQALSHFLNKDYAGAGRQYLASDRSELEIKLESTLADAQFNELLLTCYDIRKDDHRLRQYLALDQSRFTMPEYFDTLRKQYPVRREYHHFNIEHLKIEDGIKQAFTILQQP